MYGMERMNVLRLKDAGLLCKIYGCVFRGGWDATGRGVSGIQSNEGNDPKRLLACRLISWFICK